MSYLRIAPVLQRTMAVCLFVLATQAILSPAFPVHAADTAGGTSGIQGSIQNAAETPSRENFGCMTSSSDVPIQGCFAMLAYYFMKLCMWGAAVVAVFLNWVLMELVYGMGQLVGNMPGVMIAWQVLRDITNVFLVFLTVFIGIAMILNVSSYGSKQLLWKVLLAALLVNFSGTFTKVVIDVSNALALNLNTLILETADQKQDCKPEEWLTATSYGGKGQNCINNGIAGAFWDSVKVMSVFNVKTMGTNVSADIVQAMMLTGIMGGIMFIVLAFVLGIGAFMLIARFVTLVFLIIVSPMAFVFWLTGTGIGGMGAQWWNALIHNSLTAPLLLLMWWMSLKMFSGLGARFDVQGSKASDAALEMSNIGNYGIFVFFLIVMAFLLASIIMAQKLSAAGANAAVKHATAIARGGGKFVGGKVGDTFLGTTARVLQHSVGGRIGRLASNQKVADWAAAGGARGWAAKRIAGVGKRAQESSFDVRHAPIVGKTMREYLGTGTLRSKTTAGGYSATMKERTGRDEATLKWLSEAKLTRDEEKRKAQEKEAKKNSLAMTSAARAGVITEDGRTAANKAAEIARKHNLDRAAWDRNQEAIKSHGLDPAVKAAELHQRAEDAQKRMEEINRRISDIQRNSRNGPRGTLTTEEDAETKALEKERTEKEQEERKLKVQADLVKTREDMLNNAGMREYVDAQAKNERYKAFDDKHSERARLRTELHEGHDTSGNQLNEAQRQEHEAKIRTLNSEISQLYGDVDRDVREIDGLMETLAEKNDMASRKQLETLKAQRGIMVEFFEAQQETAEMSDAAKKSGPAAEKLKQRLERRLADAQKHFDDGGVVRGSMDRIDARYDAIAKGRATRRRETFFDTIHNEGRWSHPFQSPTDFKGYANDFIREQRKKKEKEPEENLLKSIIKQLEQERKKAEAGGAGTGSGNE